jgi:uncharacterized protein (TIGR02246 family)
MGVKRPQDISSTFAALLNARDRSGLLALYTDDAVLTIDGATVARGKAEIGKMVAPFFDGPLKLQAKCVAWHEAGDTALVRNDWTLNAADGSVAMAGKAAEVLRRGADGLWRLAIDDATFASR